MATEVVIVDDQELMRLSLRMVIESQPDLRVTGEAADGEEAIEVALELRPDVLVMDVRMPRLDGIAAARAIRAADPEARIILVTTFDAEQYAEPAWAAGAYGFLLKDIPPAGLLDAIRSVARGQVLRPLTAPGARRR